MSLIGIIALILVGLQLGVTLLFQFPPFASRGMRLDLLGVVPRWKFFADRLGNFDYEIELCVVHADGSTGPWWTAWRSDARRWHHGLWNAHAYRWRAQWHAIAMLDRRIAAGRDADPDRSLAYARLLRLARAAIADRHDAAGLRFAIVRCRAEERENRFTSPVHAALRAPMAAP